MDRLVPHLPLQLHRPPRRAGLSKDGLPVGLQVAARRFADDTLLAACGAFEEARPWAATYKRVEGAT